MLINKELNIYFFLSNVLVKYNNCFYLNENFVYALEILDF